MRKVFEALDKAAASKDGKTYFIDKFLVIRNVNNGVEYTIDHVDLSDTNNPVVSAYRYELDGNKIHIKLGKADFKKFERV